MRTLNPAVPQSPLPAPDSSFSLVVPGVLLTSAYSGNIEAEAFRVGTYTGANMECATSSYSVRRMISFCKALVKSQK